MKTQVKGRLDLTGVTPLVINNIELADDAYEFTAKIKEITDKGKRGRMTPEMREQKEALQWRGSLYPGDSIIFPARNFIRAFRDAAGAFSKTPAIDRGGVAVTDVEIQVLHDGPAELIDKDTGLRYGPVDWKAMYDSPRYRFRTIVNGNPTSGKKAMIPAMRPIFPVWAMSLSVIVFTDILGWEDFQKILDTASVQGIGNGRKLGYGKFDVKVTEL